jgi:hypothetical protein
MRCTECSASVFDLGRCACVPQYLTFGLCACARRCNDDRTCNKTLVVYDATLHVARSILQLANWHVRSPVGSCGHDTCSITHISTALAILHESCAAYAMHGTAWHGTARHLATLPLWCARMLSQPCGKALHGAARAVPLLRAALPLRRCAHTRTQASPSVRLCHTQCTTDSHRKQNTAPSRSAARVRSNS